MYEITIKGPHETCLVIEYGKESDLADALKSLGELIQKEGWAIAWPLIICAAINERIRREGKTK